MPTMKSIKKRISSVNNTKKIMKAMDLVSASKLQKAKTLLDETRPLCENLQRIIDGIKTTIRPEDEIAFAEKRDVKTIGYIVLTSDRGLCGSYNTNVAKETLAMIEERTGKEERIIAVGARGWEYFRRRGKNVAQKFPGPSEETTYEDARAIADRVSEMFAAGEIDEAHLVYTHFETLLSHVPISVKLLPVKEDVSEGGNADADYMTYDPDIKTFLSHAIPMYLSTTIYGALIESMVCEQAARMTSMDAATRSATEIIDDLTLEYNRKRQNLITQEITEIVSGANALQ